MSSSALDGLLREYSKVSDAPDLYALERRAEQERKDIGDVVHEESFRRYKAIDAHGNVWLIQNPAILTFQVAMRAEQVIDIERKMHLTAKEASSSRIRGGERSKEIAYKPDQPLAGF